jgi:hypothetical protein
MSSAIARQIWRNRGPDVLGYLAARSQINALPAPTTANEKARRTIATEITTALRNRMTRAGAGDKFGAEYWRKRENDLRAQLKRLGG